ncbi:hypothetical protein KP509_08G017400 [Ceratopteris richardii]|uniref:LOB domain-containing protein n=1 Tax=Ceratopteris richardii TaxID=49495 RepID=A0A8T2UAE7_CERRI|nr:hypothetical protein KP509_08G017400 [Ceratopteris richardii]
MSCNGCRVLRKGCSDTCILRSSLQWIDSPEAQGHATVFVAKFFGRAGMISFISAVSESQRPALFQSLLYEACGRTVNPVFGAVGLLWSGNWAVCQAAVETVLKGGTLRPGAVPMPAMAPCKQPINLPAVTSDLSAPAHTTAIPFASANPHLKRPLPTHMFAGASTTKQAKPSVEVDSLHTRSENLPEASAITSEVGCASAEPLSGLLSKQARCGSGCLPETISCDFAGNDKRSFMEKICANREGVAPAPRGQLHAPVPRRVKPQFTVFPSSATPREQSSPGQQSLKQQTVPREEADGNLELHLSLNSHGNHGDLSMWKMGSPPIFRVPSPSEFSVNSEGSVTNSDTAEYTMSCLRTLSSQGHHLIEERNLIHLL